MSTTVRISDETHHRLAALAAETGQRMQTVLTEAVDAYEASHFWAAFSAGYERLASDPDAWAEVQAERAGEAASLADDLNSDG